MIFTELVLENFGPYAGKQTINLRPDLEENTRPIILFGAMNGGGKTTLMDAIRLALYGQRAQCSTRGNLSYSDFLTQCVNTQNPFTEGARIELAFQHLQEEQWRELRIVRYWSKNPKEGKDTLGIIVDDAEYSDSGLANIWDEYIEALLPLGISNLFLFDGEQVKELAEQETPPQAVIEAIQSLLGLELAERLAIDLEVLVGRKKKALVNAIKREDLEKIEAKLQKCQQEAESAQDEILFLENQSKIAEKKFKAASNKFHVEGGKIAGDRSKIEQEKSQLESALEKQRDFLVSLASGTFPLALIIPLLQEAKSQGEKELKTQQVKMAQEVLMSRDQRLLEHLSQLDFEGDKISKIKSFLDQENQKLNQEIEEVKVILGINEKEAQNLSNFLDHQMPLQLNQAKEQLESLEKIMLDIDAKERELAVAASPEEYEKLSKNVEEAQQEWSRKQTALEMGKRRHQEALKSISKVKQELQKYTQEVIDYQNAEHILKAVDKVQKTLQIFRERLTLKKLNKLEKEVTECFRYLLHKFDLVQRVAIDNDNFALSLYDGQGKLVPKHRLSAGEKQLLAIAFLWGLARVSGRRLPVAIDTPLGRLDSSHRSHLVERYFPAASHQVILLSTDTEINETEYQTLKELEAIAQKYLLQYEPEQRQTMIYENRYFW